MMDLFNAVFCGSTVLQRLRVAPTTNVELVQDSAWLGSSACSATQRKQNAVLIQLYPF